MPHRRDDTGRALRVSEDGSGSQGARNLSPPLPPPIQDHFIQLLAQGLHVGIGEGSVEGVHAVRVRTDAGDGVVELGLAHFTGWALGSIAAVVPLGDVEGETNVRSTVTDADRRRLVRAHGVRRSKVHEPEEAERPTHRVLPTAVCGA